MKRVIVDFKKLTENILNLLIEKFPDGYNDSDIITFENAAGENIEAVEVRTQDTIYLVKVSFRLEESMINHAEDDDDDEDEDVDVETNDLIPDDETIDFENSDDEEE